MRVVIATVVLAIALVHPSAEAASLQGRVVRWGTSEPIARATVELRPQEGVSPAPYVATTTGDGAFVFSDIPAGPYRLVAMRSGYVNAEYGQRWPNGAGTPLTLPPGQAVSNVPIPMLQTGAISGTVRDPLGRPLGNAEIQAFKATYQTGRRVLRKVQSVQSDDRGEYRLFWLAPGRYFVAARHADLSNSPMRAGGIMVGGGGGIGPGGPIRYQQFRTGGDNASATPVPGLNAAAQTRKEEYMAVYYPNTTDETSAAPIDVTPGGEVRAIDFTVAPVPKQRVRGRVVYESNNEPAMSARVQYVTSTGMSPADDERSIFGPFAGAVAVECCDGAFELGLPSGSYTLVAAVNNQNARTSVNVGDGDVDGVLLALSRGFNITGRVTFEGRTATAAELSAIRISLAMNPPVAGLAPTSYSNVLPTGALTLQAGRGDFRISILPMLSVAAAFPVMPPPNVPASMKDAYVKSVRFGSVDVLDRGLRLDGETQDQLDIVIGTATGTLDGRVVSDARQPVPNVIVALLPDAPRRSSRPDLVKTTSSDSSGRFRLDRIPPGDYVAFAFDGVDESEWQNPDYIAARESRGAAVRVTPGDPVTVELIALPSN